MDDQELQAIFKRISNWERWGKDDELGTLNCITQTSVTRGFRAVRSGTRVSCALPILTTAGEAGREAIHHSMLRCGHGVADTGSVATTDTMCIACHGPMFTHLDALCHMLHDGRMYNGRDRLDVAPDGARANHIGALTRGISGRGILLDICRLRDQPYVDHDTPVCRAELEEALERTGETIEPGDCLLIRLGREVRRRMLGPECEMRDGKTCLAGLHPDTLQWLHGLDLALLGSDAAHDAIPNNYRTAHVPIHVGCLVYMGLHLLDNANLDPLAEHCASAGQCSFFFAVMPLAVPGATGSMVNPLAIM